MSRYVKNLPDGGFVAYGYDRPLQEYFIQKWDAEGECEWSVGNYHPTMDHPDHPGKRSWSNSELLKLFEQFDLDQAHIEMLVLDLPF